MISGTMPPKKPTYSTDDTDSSDVDSGSKIKRARMEKGSHDYKKRRERNNVAVRKSRDKSRQKAKETVVKVQMLREENEALEQKVQLLNKELGVLKDLFLAHAGAVSEKNNNSTTDPSDHKYSIPPKIKEE